MKKLKMILKLKEVKPIMLKMSRKEALSQFIQQIHGRPVVVKLNSGVDYRGVLACLDGYMNIALEQTEEYVNGQLKNKYEEEMCKDNQAFFVFSYLKSGELLK
ncbi:hypothetical protein L9F63_027881, partial [Diploptera punctata]